MNHNIIERNERLAKVAGALPSLSADTLIVNDYTHALQHLVGNRWNIYTSGKASYQSVPPTVDGVIMRLRSYGYPLIKSNCV